MHLEPEQVLLRVLLILHVGPVSWCGLSGASEDFGSASILGIYKTAVKSSLEKSGNDVFHVAIGERGKGVQISLLPGLRKKEMALSIQRLE